MVCSNDNTVSLLRVLIGCKDTGLIVPDTPFERNYWVGRKRITKKSIKLIPLKEIK